MNTSTDRLKRMHHFDLLSSDAPCLSPQYCNSVSVFFRKKCMFTSDFSQDISRRFLHVATAHFISYNEKEYGAYEKFARDKVMFRL